MHTLHLECEAAAVADPAYIEHAVPQHLLPVGSRFLCLPGVLEQPTVMLAFLHVPFAQRAGGIACRFQNLRHGGLKLLIVCQDENDVWLRRPLHVPTKNHTQQQACQGLNKVQFHFSTFLDPSFSLKRYFLIACYFSKSTRTGFREFS